MAETQYAEQLATLCSEYFERRLSMVEYRTRRKQIIDQMAHLYNGEEAEPARDDTQPRWKSST